MTENFYLLLFARFLWLKRFSSEWYFRRSNFFFIAGCSPQKFAIFLLEVGHPCWMETLQIGDFASIYLMGLILIVLESLVVFVLGFLLTSFQQWFHYGKHFISLEFCLCSGQLLAYIVQLFEHWGLMIVSVVYCWLCPAKM